MDARVECRAGGRERRFEVADREPGVPPDDVLERAGARFGEIVVSAGNIFDLEDPEENVRGFRMANRVHQTTRPAVIRAQLLFRSGDLYSSRTIAESERLLRRNRYLYDARVRPVRYHHNRVDVEVVTRDVWTLKPGISFSRQGGANSSRFEIQDSNFLGTGRDLTLEHRTTVDRTTSELRFRDRNLMGSRVQLEVGYSDNSDGDARELSIERPFFSFDSRWAMALGATTSDRVDALYSGGEIAASFRHRRSFVEVSGGISRGLREARSRRWSAGLTYDASAFSVAEGLTPPAELPLDRRLAYPWLQLASVEDRFLEDHNLDHIARTEDVPLGRSYRIRLGWASPVLGADRQVGIFETSLARGFQPGDGRLMLLSTAASGRWGQGGFENVLAGIRGRYYQRNFTRHVFYAELAIDATYRRDRDRQLLLGGDSGLRGYPLRYQDGDRRFLLTLEQRFYTKWHLFRMIHVGSAVFFDVGRAWHADRDAAERGVLKNVGAGLRLGSSRSGRGSLVHLDLALPLDGDSSIRSLQWLVKSRESF